MTPAPQQPDPKAFDTLRARAALAGHQLYRTADQDGDVRYFCCRWGMARAMGSLDEVERFLSQVGA